MAIVLMATLRASEAYFELATTFPHHLNRLLNRHLTPAAYAGR
jgi:hypothetical protein